MRGFILHRRILVRQLICLFIRVYSLKAKLFYTEIKQTQPRISVYRFFVAQKKITYS